MFYSVEGLGETARRTAAVSSDRARKDTMSNRVMKLFAVLAVTLASATAASAQVDPFAQLYRPAPNQTPAPARPANPRAAASSPPNAAPSPALIERSGRIDPRATMRGRVDVGVNNRLIEFCGSAGCTSHRSEVKTVVDDMVDGRPISVGPGVNRDTVVNFRSDGPWLVCATLDPLRYNLMKIETRFCRLIDGTGTARFPQAPMQLGAQPLLPGPAYDPRPIAEITAGAKCASTNCQAERAEMSRVGRANLGASAALMAKAQAMCRAYSYGAPLTIDTASYEDGVITMEVACEA